jgi:tyrosinase
MARQRRSVYSLDAEAPELDWYRKAVKALKQLPPEDPRSWWFIGFCHGVPGGVPQPPDTAGLWNECQHQTWFFLPWHRAYLAGFEAMIAAEVENQGGPAEWALPYWDYSDAANPQARLLPPAFRDRLLPDGTENDLWAPRNQPVQLLAGDVDLSATMSTLAFSSGGMSAGFGGPETGWNHFGGANGEMERVPHNAVHGAVGGWMNNPNTAALDPVFWLHHCNIDRLWEVWRGLTYPPRDPQAASWLSGVSFRLVGAAGTTFDFTAQQALDTQALLHGYVYEGVTPVVPAQLVAGGPPPAGPQEGAPGGRPLEAAFESARGLFAAMAEERRSELVGASEAPVKLGAGHSESVLRMGGAEAVPGIEAAARGSRGARRHYLRLEGVVASGAARDYKVFLDLPDDDRVPMQVGVLATFGVEAASAEDGRHGGNGLTQVLDVTAAVDELAIGAAQFGRVRVTFEAIERPGLEAVPENLPYAEALRQPPAELIVETIGLYSE